MSTQVAVRICGCELRWEKAFWMGAEGAVERDRRGRFIRGWFGGSGGVGDRGGCMIAIVGRLGLRMRR